MVGGYASRASPANVTLEPTIDCCAPAIDAPSMRAVFDAPRAPTIGIEEELMLLDPGTRDLAPLCEEALAALASDTRFRAELVAAQIEIATPPRNTVAGAAQVLREARGELVGAVGGRALVAGAGVHPFAAGLGELHGAARYHELATEFASVARRQLVFGLHVHVAISGAERAVAVHDALRSHLPALAGLAANAPFYEGRDTGLASVRPTIAAMLPRQGVPPALGTWAAFERALSWGEGAGVLPAKQRWWWELRLHPTFGTIEVRVADTQTTVDESAAYAAVVHALVTWLAERFDAGEALPVAPTWRIAENRWWAARHGLDASFADLVTGEREPLRVRLERLFDELAPVAARLGCAADLERARALAAGPGGASRQRAAAARGGLDALAGWLAERVLA